MNETYFSIPAEFLQDLSEENRHVVESFSRKMDDVAEKNKEQSDGAKITIPSTGISDIFRILQELKEIPLLILFAGCLFLFVLQNTSSYRNTHGGIASTNTIIKIPDNTLVDRNEIIIENKNTEITSRPITSKSLRRSNTRFLIASPPSIGNNASNYKNSTGDYGYIPDNNYSVNAGSWAPALYNELTTLYNEKSNEGDCDDKLTYLAKKYQSLSDNKSVIQPEIIYNNKLNNYSSPSSAVNACLNNQLTNNKTLPTLTANSHNITPILITLLKASPED